MRRLMVTSWLRYEPRVVVKVSRMKPVGPSTSPRASSTAANARLKLESHLMPRSTHVAEEAMYSPNASALTARSEARRHGKARVSTCSLRCARQHQKKKNQK